MKKIITLLLAVMMILALTACAKKPEETPNNHSDSGNNQSQTNQDGNSAPEGATTDQTKLGEAITYWVEDDYLYFKIKTSAEIDAKKYNIDIVNPGIYLTRNSDFIKQSIYGNTNCFAEEFDKEWFDGYYIFWVDNNMITSLASAESEWAPGIWSMLLYNEDNKLVLGQWLIVFEGDGKYHFEYSDSWLYGAGEERKIKEFDSLQDEVASWFSFNAYSEEWSDFFFSGYYLEQVDPEGYDTYYLMICPEGDYSTYREADAVDYTYSGFSEKCPYKFSMENYCIPNLGKYTFVLAKMGGNVEVQFDGEKINASQWKMDFSNAKCPKLESKYSQNSEQVPVVSEGGNELSDSEVLKLCGLTLNDIITETGKSAGEIVETSDILTVPIYCEDASFNSFEVWLNALAENCKKVSTDGKLYEDEFTWTEINAFELDSKGINVILFIYKIAGHSVYVTASNDHSVEGAFSLRIQLY